ncbi:accessory Sec system S-layer assembly protein [Alkalicoccus urumqiensis]|uniref:Accessory Sec system S-layer assembly protein n=1 Tax=Alkalicoccus urumqiensis TaxID=1548213 RepID=A0A2P6MHD6_ALKUR|nr:accessory Sec system S-layer assembly protein [Alkalicoccus urumqiensis]PRO65687.1 accessory Sec system S-layer assembly protein [Alkalicoccus urumqiensis]
MLPFFNKKNKDELELEGSESSVSSEEMLQESGESSEESVETELSIHPSWNLPEEDIYAFRFLNMECEPLKPNQLSLYGINVDKQEDGTFNFNAFVRHSINKKIKLENAVIVLLDTDDSILGRKEFDLSKLGEMPPNSSRPWTFPFTAKDLFADSVPQKGWKLAFQLKPSSRKHSLELTDSWKRSLAVEEQKKLENVVDNMEPPKHGEVNFLGLKATLLDEQQELHVTLLVRNGGEKNINLEQLPLQVEDAEGDIIAKGGFKMDPKLHVKANTSTPWNFVFPQAMLLKDNPDLSRWKAYPPNRQKTNG